MIDYEKLKIAHELVSNMSTHYLVHIIGHKGHEYTIVDWIPDMPDWNYKILDDLISKLQELTKPKCKYEVGQEVWRVDDESKPWSFVISGVDHEKETLFLEDALVEHDMWWLEEQLYPTREALILAQIDYWKNLLAEELEQHVSSYCEPKCQHSWINRTSDLRKLCEHCFEVEKCQHESDGLDYLSFPPKANCKKCGEYY